MPKVALHTGAIPAVTLNRYLPQLTRRTGSGAEPIAKQAMTKLRPHPSEIITNHSVHKQKRAPNISF
eukprot:2070608-Amphidinium_carterae.1